MSRPTTTPTMSAPMGWPLNHVPAPMPIAAEYKDQEMEAMAVSPTNRRREKPTPPAVMFTATRPTGMKRAARMNEAPRRSRVR